MMKKQLAVIALASLTMAQPAMAQKQKLSVLYVGGSAEIEVMGVAKIDSVKLKATTKSRFASFEKFLKSKFKTVKAIYAENYKPEMSDQYDVTVFDGRPKAWRGTIMERDEKGNITRYERPAYLPFNFDRPTVMIANASEDLGRSIGTKNDWYCLCLNAHAHHWVKDHAIFKGPFKVKIKTEMRDTPSGALEYAKMMGDKLPSQTEMWRVQTTSYETTPDYRIGMVSRPVGYLDSPETEIISSGECAKSIDAVAIGRHANFFHWGFSASPDYLTEAGKAALANAIVYISKFKNEHVIARKMNESIANREHDIKAKKYSNTPEAWKDYVESNRKFYAQMDSIHKSAVAKKAKGEELNDADLMYLDYDASQRPKEPTFAEYMKRREPQLYHVFGDDGAAYAQWYDKNAGWLYPTSEGYYLDLDEDARTLGIANNDKAILDRCITMLEKGEEEGLARRVLHRYTLCRFATAQEWRQWFEAYKDKLFFSESGGFLWLVNTQDRSVPGNDYSVLEGEPKTVKATPTAGVNKDNPVALSASLNTTADGSKQIVVGMKIFTDFHTYGTVSSKDPFIPTKVEVELPQGYELVGQVKSTVAKPSAPGSETTYYTDEATFTQTIKGKGAGTAKVTVSYQACDASMCYPPAEKTLTVELK